MFHKLHWQMTFFSALITSGILVLMAFFYLLISEQGITRNSYERFLNNGNSCITYLENQTVISHKWLLEAKQEYGAEIRILDNGQRLYFDKMQEQNQMENMIKEAARISKEEQGLDTEYTGSIALTKEVFFKTTDFYACTALLPKANGVLSLLMVYPLGGVKEQILHQRIWYLALVLMAILALFTFSWLFTGKMLYPLEENQKKQTEFIAAASHELRSPLAVILSCVQTMEESAGEKEKLIQTIKSEGNRMTRLVGDMLSLANADNRSWSIIKKDSELDTLILDTYEKYEHIFQEKKISLQVLLPEESLSPCCCDSARVSQVLAILLENGISYVPFGGKVRIGVEEKEKYFQIYVQDNGPGIKDERKKAVFDRFYRGDSARGEKQHFGLGLCIAKEIMMLHKGDIWVEDTPGGGSTFVMRLPK